MQRFLKGIPVTEQLLMGFKTSLIILPFKLMVTYFALYVLLKAVLNENRRAILPLIGMFITTVASIILFRVAFYYYINPVVYAGREGHPPLFSVINIWLAFLEIGFVAAIAVIIKFVRLQLKSKENEKNLVKEKLETELKFLRNQTNPHFLFNTLNNIYALSLKKSDDTPEVVLKLSKLLNFMLYESRKASISIGDELKILDDYIELERIRYNGRLEISFIREIDNESEQMAPLLLLSFVENAFKHGASESRFESYIHIDMKLNNGILTFNIENNKENYEKLQSNGSIGLANVRRQLELMYTDYDLKVDDETNHFNVGLMINLNSHAKV
jgi:two-component system, LytTR family, sensor kinase